MNANANGNGATAVKIVRRTLADGTVKEYRYDQDAARQRNYVARRAEIIKQITTAFLASPEFRGLADNTRRQKREYIAIIEAELGWMSVSELEDRSARTEFYTLRDKYQGTPARADALMGALRALLAWAQDRGLIEENRALGIKRLRDKTISRAECLWSDDLFARLMAVSAPDFQAVLTFAKLTGCRKVDICKLCWGQFDGEWLVYKPQKTERKTGVVVHLPVFALAPLRELLAKCKRGAADAPLLETVTGLRWTETNIRNRFETAIEDAAISDDLHFHDLRGTLDTHLQEARCTETEAASILGHVFGEKVKQGRAYVARTRVLALNAYAALDRYLKGGAPVLTLVKSA